MSRTLTPLDQFITRADRLLRGITHTSTAPKAERPSPAHKQPEAPLKAHERKHAAGLMRVNHAGEVCAQALYRGQALTAKLPQVRNDMERAAAEEVDHLVWCQERLDELGSHASYLNPLWYGLSFTLGAGAGLVGDRVSLGFVAATEDQVCQHLESHMKKLPVGDRKSRAVVEQMLDDEARHADMALAAGGMRFPAPVKSLMTMVSKVMTETSYRL
ncbi:2-polyprenyl-3-methyl-6-methoxy-1,4-benzoquinone monooxygenase [Marinimicrobium sp. ABcell2]|uniref:2-polyprenyl-3-methyl-6-methoxy-1,4-benzoquinone monooxygenase n=1 Tax=Marinimicrobium sp. ABcell2 TaxID=3069751 RepID=UPI0027AEBB4F|nr:2-polyprenyl-3-methyl-6-methoxy-1,4-benzoquinone monooxygenase [Marinimicrobium sp. ABcell2]MDQ2077614.1 2-polyprenyl-3-methyl-6-methoxy-1,4-benzoquinone monooxygenase [Marinimicrobium sp. ABcell2]